MKRCALCLGGKLPSVLRVDVIRVFGQRERIVVLSCAACQSELSVASLAKVNKQTVKVRVYE